MPLSLQVTLSLLLVTVVLWFMWRSTRSGEAFFGWAPMLALVSVWGGLLSLTCSLIVWFIKDPGRLLPLMFMFLDPVALGTGTLVLWIYRRSSTHQDTIDQQIVQAKVGLLLGGLAVLAGYAFVFTHRAPGT